METNETDAQVDSSPTPAAGAESALESANSSQGEVPVQNLIGEFNRKFGQLQRQIEALSANQTMAQQTAYVPQPQYNAPSDEQLWEAAKQGDRSAFEEYQRRIASREIQGTLQSQNVVNLVDRQMQVVMQKYPVLQDASHPLTQTVAHTYRLLVQSGFPQNKGTMLEAAKTAIADNPTMIAQMHSEGVIAGEQNRRSATSVARAGQTGVTYRQGGGSTTPKAPQITQEVADLAKKMNVKDPAGAIQRFKERRAKGTSQIGAVGAFLDDEDL